MDILAETRVSEFDLNRVLKEFSDFHARDRQNSCRAPLFYPNHLVLAHQLDANSSSASWEPLDPNTVDTSAPCFPSAAADPYLSNAPTKPWSMEEVAALAAVVEAKTSLQSVALQLGRTHRDVAKFYYSHKHTDILRSCLDNSKQPPHEVVPHPFSPPQRLLLRSQGSATDIVACNWHALRHSAPYRSLPPLSFRIVSTLWKSRAARALSVLEGLSAPYTLGRRGGRPLPRPLLRPHVRVTDDIDAHVATFEDAAEVFASGPTGERVDGGLRYFAAQVERMLPPQALPFFRVWLGAACSEDIGLTRAMCIFIKFLRPLLLPPGCGGGSATAPRVGGSGGCSARTPTAKCSTGRSRLATSGAERDVRGPRGGSCSVGRLSPGHGVVEGGEGFCGEPKGVSESPPSRGVGGDGGRRSRASLPPGLRGVCGVGGGVNWSTARAVSALGGVGELDGDGVGHSGGPMGEGVGGGPLALPVSPTDDGPPASAAEHVVPRPVDVCVETAKVEYEGADSAVSRTRAAASALQVRVATALQGVDSAACLRPPSPPIGLRPPCDVEVCEACPLDVLMMRAGGCDVAAAEPSGLGGGGGGGEASRLGPGDVACPSALTASRYANLRSLFVWNSVPAPRSAHPDGVCVSESVSELHNTIDTAVGALASGGTDPGDLEDDALLVKILEVGPCAGWDARVVVATARIRAERVEVDADDADDMDGDGDDGMGGGDSSDG